MFSNPNLSSGIKFSATECWEATEYLGFCPELVEPEEVQVDSASVSCSGISSNLLLEEYFHEVGLAKRERRGTGHAFAKTYLGRKASKKPFLEEVEADYWDQKGWMVGGAMSDN